MHGIVAVSFLSAVVWLAGSGTDAAQSAGPAQSAPLPNASELLQRALASERKIAAERERYECRVTDVTTETDSQGNVKKDHQRGPGSVLRERYSHRAHAPEERQGSFAR